MSPWENDNKYKQKEEEEEEEIFEIFKKKFIIRLKRVEAWEKCQKWITKNDKVFQKNSNREKNEEDLFVFVHVIDFIC